MHIKFSFTQFLHTSRSIVQSIVREKQNFQGICFVRVHIISKSNIYQMKLVYFISGPCKKKYKFLIVI